jgi:FAD/FMN-containing dehydrogenase
MLLLPFLFTLHLPLLARAALLDFETTQLQDAEAERYPVLRFADTHKKARGRQSPKCKAFPGTDSWPDEDDWADLRAALGPNGLLHPQPAAHVCYAGRTYDAERCRFLVQEADRSHFWVDDPLATLTQWPQGNTCRPSLETAGRACERGGFPEYVVNATTARHVQAAVNFARNRHVRLVVKNTGHDFGGRSLGAGSVSVWTHHMREFRLLPRYTQGQYSGMAAQFGAGLEAWEIFNRMSEHNITVVAAGGRTVGANGGWFASGGHGNLASYYGLGADQALEIHVVTADGRFVVATPTRNKDLFFALRGGGGSKSVLSKARTRASSPPDRSTNLVAPGTYGIVTSVVVKAYPPISTTRHTVTFQVNNGASDSVYSVDGTDRFWAGINTYFRFERTIVDAGGVDWNYIYPLGPTSYLFRCFVTLPGKTSNQTRTLFRPLYDAFRAAGLNMTLPDTFQTSSYVPAAQSPAPAEPLAETRYRSRLFPRANWDDAALFRRTMAAVRDAVEANYTFHGLAMSPTEEVAGWPGRSAAVHPAWRRAILHAILIGPQPAGLTAQEARAEEAAVQVHMKAWRAVSPGAGSYMNEGDPGEPNWQQAFYGGHYPRLLRVKEDRDPWGVFWAQTTVGSEGWEVRSVDGYPRSQNGRLCRV